MEEFNPALIEDYPLIDIEEAKVGVSDSVRLYLTEIGRIPLLTEEEERILSKQIKDGILAEEEKKSIDDQGLSNITVEYYKRLEAKIELKNSSIDKLVSANLRLVVSIAKRFKTSTLDLMDLVQEGSMGLMRAALKYDYEMGYRFSTYASWWIRQSITRCIADQGRTIRIPVHITEEIRKLSKAKRDLIQELGHEPTLRELEERTGFNRDKILALEEYHNSMVSMDTRVGDEEESTLGDFIPDNTSKTPLEYTIENTLKEEIDHLLDEVLSDKEKFVIVHRLGLNGNKPKTLEDIASLGEVKVTRERIRQIEASAYKKLRRSNEFLKIMEAYNKK